MQNIIRNLSDLTKPELEQLSKLNNKAALVITHPYYQFPKNPGLDDFLTNEKRKGRLVIILEEEKELEHLKKKLIQMGANTNHTILLVPTLPHNAQPTTGWKNFFKKFDALKIRRIVVGGRQQEKITFEEILKRTPLPVRKFPGAQKVTKKDYLDYNQVTRARINAAKANAKRGYTSCAGTTWSMLKVRGGKQKVKMVQNQFTAMFRKR